MTTIFLAYGKSSDRGTHDCRRLLRCRCLISANYHDEAYEKSIQFSKALPERISSLSSEGSESLELVGTEDLLFLENKPEDGAEIFWSEAELTPQELQRELRQMDKLRVFKDRSNSKWSGWCVGSIVLREVHDEGSHGDHDLVWVNSYLFRASDPEAAYKRVQMIGGAQNDESGSHRCDGDKAHWQFEGVHDLIATLESPGDGALLWCDQVEVNISDFWKLLKQKKDMSVYMWEAGIGRAGGPD